MPIMVCVPTGVPKVSHTLDPAAIVASAIVRFAPVVVLDADWALTCVSTTVPKVVPDANVTGIEVPPWMMARQVLSVRAADV